MKILLSVFLLSFFLTPAFAGQEYYIEEVCGGGFTGGSSGIRIHRDGRIFDMRQNSYDMPAEELFIGRDADAAARLFALAESNGFLATRLDRHENWTCSITYRSPAKKHRVQCGGSCANAPGPVAELSDELNKLNRKIRNIKSPGLDRGRFISN